MRRPAGIVAAVALLVSVLASAPASAFEKVGPQVIPPEVAAAQAAAKQSQLDVIKRRLALGDTPDYFGTECCQILQIPAAAFSAVEGATAQGDASLGYLYPDSFGGPYDFWAPVLLPTGAHIVFLDLYYYDTSMFDFAVELRALSGGHNGIGGTGNPTASTVAQVFSAGAAGYNYAVTLTDYVVNNNVAFDPNAAQLILRTFFIVTDGTQSFKGVDIWWHRDVSPAPAAATFNDVPTNDFGFQYIEALADSGITGGCQAAPPLYCPDNFVTRRQMAIFIAKALGLYWPY